MLTKLYSIFHALDSKAVNDQPDSYFSKQYSDTQVLPWTVFLVTFLVLHEVFSTDAFLGLFTGCTGTVWPSKLCLNFVPVFHEGSVLQQSEVMSPLQPTMVVTGKTVFLHSLCTCFQGDDVCLRTFMFKVWKTTIFKGWKSTRFLI